MRHLSSSRIDWRDTQASSIIIIKNKKTLLRVLFFVPSSIGSLLRCFVASLRRCLSRVSCLVCVVASRSLGLALGRWRISFGCRCERARERHWRLEQRWETILLIVMLESSSRSAPCNEAMMMASSATLWPWCSTIIEVSCSSLILVTIECKYSHVMMARSCPSSATNQASSCIHGALRSITIMIASSSLIPAIVEYNHGH